MKLFVHDQRATCMQGSLWGAVLCRLDWLLLKQKLSVSIWSILRVEWVVEQVAPSSFQDLVGLLRGKQTRSRKLIETVCTNVLTKLVSVLEAWSVGCFHVHIVSWVYVRNAANGFVCEQMNETDSVQSPARSQLRFTVSLPRYVCARKR